MTTLYGIDWDNVNLDSSYERDQNILTSYNFDTLLLEVHCNMRTQDITELSILKHAQSVLQVKHEQAKEILLANIGNITKQALKERKDV